MNITEEVKELIANGKTEEALQWLQDILKEKEKDNNLLNQTYLLQSQYKDMKQRMRLGLQDASTELNRINFTLLTICDDVDKAGIQGEKSPNDKNNASPSKDNLKSALWIFGVIVFIVIALVIAVVIYSKK